MRKRWIATFIALCLSVATMGVLSACAGEQGPQGEKGEQGEQGIPGIQGEAGKDGITPTIEISSDGYWVINGDKTEYKAVGQDGVDGSDGITPSITISTDGYWVINDEKTEYKAIGKDGANGNNGNDGRGIVSVAYDKDGNLVITYTDNTSDTVILPEKEEHAHTYGEWIRYSEDDTNCEKVFYYQVCDTCNAVEWRIGSEEDHVWEETYSYGTTHHYIGCEKCGINISGFERHTLDEKGNCTICKHFIGGLHYKFSADQKSAIVTSYDGISQLVIIPEEYQGVPVTTIDEDAFLANSTIYSVYLPDTIVTIEDSAFAFSSLTYITLPDSVKTIESYAFMDCYNLREFEISKNVETIGAGAFVGTVNLGLSVHNENQHFKYEGNALYSKDGTVLYWYNDCDSLITSFIIPTSVKIIEQEAFVGCRWLKQLTISSSVIEIKASAFIFITPQRPNEVIFEITEGWVCTELEELGDDIYEPTSEYLETSGASAIWNFSAYNWKRG